MGFKVVINSRLSNLSKVTLLVNDRITIHFKSVSREVWREGHSWVLSVYTFLFFLLQENIFRKESGVFWLLQRRVFYTVFLDQPYPLQSMDSILSPKGHVRSWGEEFNINPASSPISGVVPVTTILFCIQLQQVVPALVTTHPSILVTAWLL